VPRRSCAVDPCWGHSIFPSSFVRTTHSFLEANAATTLRSSFVRKPQSRMSASRSTCDRMQRAVVFPRAGAPLYQEPRGTGRDHSAGEMQSRGGAPLLELSVAANRVVGAQHLHVDPTTLELLDHGARRAEPAVRAGTQY
jgi:hypothetical protein